MNISDNIKAIRTQKGIAQAEIARRLEIEPSSYHRLENRGSKLTLEQTENIAQALGVTWLELVTWGEGREAEPIVKRSISELQEKIKELTTARDIAQDYVEDLKRKTYNLDAIFHSTIQSIGKEAKLGSEELVEEDELFVLYSTTFTDKELMIIFEIIFNDHPILYSVFKDILQRDIIDTSRRIAKLFLKYIDQKNKHLDQ